MIAASNLFIYATQPHYCYLIAWIQRQLPAISPITQIETLGYHHLQTQNKALLEMLFDCLDCLYPTPITFSIAIQLRQQRNCHWAMRLLPLPH